MKKVALMYHDVYHLSTQESGFDTDGANHYKISETLFEGHLKVLSELIERNLIHKDDIVLTFDDGGVSSSTIILPLLDKYGFKGHFFVSTNYIGTYRFVDIEHIQHIINNGHIVGSHSCSHPSNISALSEFERFNEWTESVTRLNNICGCSTDEISIPNGFFLKEDIKLYKSMGIKTVYTSSVKEYHTIDGVKVIGRISIDASTTIKKFKGLVTGGLALQIMIARQAMLQVLKLIFGNQYILIKKRVRKYIH